MARNNKVKKNKRQQTIQQARKTASLPAGSKKKETTQQVNKNQQSQNSSIAQESKGGGRRNTASRQQVGVNNHRNQPAQNDAGKRIWNATKGTVKQTVGSHQTTFNAIRNPNEKRYITAEEFKKERETQQNKKTSKFQDGQYMQLVNRERYGNVDTREKNLEKASKRIESGGEDIEKAKKGFGKGGKFAVDTYSAMLGLGMDAMAGPASGVSMFSRSFGSAYDTAKKEGADDSRAALYGAGVGALETASEKLFAVATPLRKIYGKGAGDKLSDKVLDKMMSKAKSKTGKEVAYNGGKVFLSALTEGLEEMVAEGLEPAIANTIYAEAIGKPHSASAGDILYAGAVGGAMGGILGGGGQVVDYRQGKKISDNAENLFGEDGIMGLIKKGLDTDDTATQAKAAAYKALIEDGSGIVNGQVTELAKQVQAQADRDNRTYDVFSRSADSLIQKNGFVSIDTVIQDENGQAIPTLRENTAKAFEENKTANAEKIETNLQLPEGAAEPIAETIAAIQTGIAGINDVNRFTISNPEARTAFSAITGIELPKTNADTKALLFELVAKNRVDSARAETEWYMDSVKGIIQKDVATGYGSEGQQAMSNMIENISIKPMQMQSFIIGFDDIYNAGRAGLDFADVEGVNNPFHKILTPEQRKEVYLTGLQDRIRDRGDVSGMRISIGESLQKISLNRKTGSHRGTLNVNISNENAKYFGAKEQKFYRELAKTFGIEIEIVDAIEGGGNGYYIDGKITLAMNADRRLEYVFSHEITHHMQKYAPEQYQKLKEFVRSRWYGKGMSEAIAAKQKQYAEHNQKLSQDEALDEIIADSTYEMLQDESFINELCAENKTLARAVLDAIKNVLDKIRAALAEGTAFTPRQNANLYAQLDILKDAEKLWADGLVKVAENKDAVGALESENEVQFSLKNKNITPQDRIPYVMHKSYMNVKQNDNKSLSALQDKVRKLKRDTYENKATGYKANITGETIGKIINPSRNGYNYWSKQYIDNLNAAIYLPELFANAVYVDTKGNAKAKKAKQQISGYHHFIAPMYMNNDEYRVRIVAREKKNSDTLYIVETEILTIKNGSPVGRSKASQFVSVPLDISIPDLVNGVKIYDYNMQKNQSYTQADIKFSLAEPVEETKELIAQHNLTEDKLLKTLELGGFPMPSIAITKTDVGHSNFGGISILFSKDTIDPADRRNKVYGADAWTPMFPTIEFKINEEKSEEIYARANKVGTLPFFNPTVLYDSNIESKIKSAKHNEKSLAEYLKNDYGMKQMYLAETDKDPVGEMKYEVEVAPAASKLDIEMRAWYLENAKELVESWKDFDGPMFTWAKWYKDEITAKYKEFYKKEFGFSDEQTNNIIANGKLGAFAKPIRNAAKSEDELKAPKTEIRTDTEAMEAAIDAKVDIKGYEAWLNELFDGIVEKEGLWNGKDPYTASGGRKSFEALHYPVTVDNIVRAMLAQSDSDRNSNSMFVGVKTLRAAAVDEFKSIKGIKKASDKLKKVDGEDFNKQKDELDSRLSIVIDDIIKNSGKNGNELIYSDEIGLAIEESCRKPTPQNIKRVLGKYTWEITDEQATEIHDIINELVDMPVAMFEAKPQRVVGFDEIVSVVVPETSSEKLTSALDKNDIEYVTYNGTEEDRLVKVNEVAGENDIRFSFRDDTDITYESLTAKPDMKVVDIKEVDISQKNRKEIVSMARKTMEQKEGQYVSYNNDVDGEIIVGAKALTHGLRRNYDDLALVTVNIGEYLKNAIKVNELKPRGENVTDSYILLGYGSSDNATYPAYFVINTMASGGNHLEDFDVLYSANAKKIEGSALSSQGFNAPLPSTISIADLLNLVNEMYSDILPKSVAEHYGNERKTSKLGESVQFSLPEESAVYDYADEHDTEFVQATPVRTYEQERTKLQNKTHEELLAQVEKLSRDKRLTKGKVLDTASIKEEMVAMMRVLMTYSESYTSDGKLRKTNLKLANMAVENAKTIYRALKDGDYVAAANTAYDVATHIVENLELVNDKAFHEYKALRDYLRTTPINLSVNDRLSIPDYNMWRRKQFGRLKLVHEGGIPADSVYMELCEMYPGLFDPEITHPADQVMAMAEVRESLEPYDVMLSQEVTQQLIKQVAQDILDVTATGKPWKSWTDKQKESYDKKLKLEKQRHQEAKRDILKKNKEHEAWLKRNEKYNERWNQAENRFMADMGAAKERAKARNKAEKQKVRKEHMKRFGHIQKNYKWLVDRLIKPTNDKHIPEIFKIELAHLLQQMDLQTEKAKKLEAKYGKAKKTLQMDAIRSRLAEIAKEDGSGVFEYDGYVFDLMEAMADRVRGKTIDELSNADLAAIDVLLTSIRTNINNYNKAFSENIKEEISALATESINSANERLARKKYRSKKLEDGQPTKRTGLRDGADSLLNYSMITPRDFFEHIGGGVLKAYLSLRKGFDRHTENIETAKNFFDELFGDYGKKTKLRKRSKPGSELEDLRNEKGIKTVTLDSGQNISLTVAQIMSLYCLSKRQQALGHILGSGIVPADVKRNGVIASTIGKIVPSTQKTSFITTTDLERIIAELTSEQIEMADKMQGFLNNECAAWGNEVSMKLYGYKKFIEPNYFPIKSSGAYTEKRVEKHGSLETIKNFGFTKGTVANANNPIEIGDIFSVVAEHVNNMSLYNAFAAPISDFMRVYNQNQKDENGNTIGSVEEAISNAYGKKAADYIMQFMKDLNGQMQQQKDGYKKLLNSTLSNYKKAAIGGNFRVALQQPTALLRAFSIMNPKYFMGNSPNVAKNIKEMRKYSGIARWKGWGYSQTDVARDIDDIMMNKEWSKIDILTMGSYGLLDDISWSFIWVAVKKEIKDTHPNIKDGSAEYFEMVSDRFAEIIDKTQVVDSVFHRSQVMRNQDIAVKTVTSFMAEPTKTYNMVRSQLMLARDLWESGQKLAAVGKANRAISVFFVNAAAVSAMAALADALRGKDVDGDDEDDDWFTNFLNNFWDNVNPINMIPVAKDAWGVTEGWSIRNMALEGLETLIKGAMKFYEEPSVENFRKVAEGAGYVFGVPVKNVLREFETICGAFGLDVFAADGTEEVEVEKGVFEKFIGSIRDYWGFDTSDNTGVSGHDRGDKDYYGIYADDGESIIDKVMDVSVTERKKKARNKRVKDIEKDVKNLSGTERQEAIWDAVTKNYTNYIKDGEFDTIDEMRKTLKACGGDVETFDERVETKTVEAYKKSIGGNANKQAMLRERLVSKYEYAEGKISIEIVAKSKTAQSMQKNLCLDNWDAAVDDAVALVEAGISYNDLASLYYNRYKAFSASDFSTGEFVYPASGDISSPYGYRSPESTNGIGSTFHEAIDIAANYGSPVIAADGGKITYANYNGGYGWQVRIDHGNGIQTWYSHLKGYYFEKGATVSKGQAIGEVGSSGDSTGPHLDFKVRRDGQFVDPMELYR